MDTHNNTITADTGRAHRDDFARERNPVPQSSLRNPHAPRHLTWPTRLLWGAVALVPLISLVAAMSVSATSTTVLFGALALFWSGLCLVFFGSHLFRLAIDARERRRWAMAMLFAAPVAVPAFWWSKVLNAPESAIQHA